MPLQRTQAVELRMDVSSLISHDETLLAGTLVAPTDVSEARTVVVAIPGGGYNRHYFDLDHADLRGPGQATWHAQRGVIFVALDPLGGGESTELAPDRCDLATTARVVDGAVRELVESLRAGRLNERLPPLGIERVVGAGHSLGGMQLVAQQGRHATFDAIAVLGWSCLHTVVPTAGGDDQLTPHHGDQHGTDLEVAWSGPLVDDLAHLRYAYHWEDVPPALVAEDLGAGFPTRTADPLPQWITASFPPFAAICLRKGVVSAEAALVQVPVFIGAGERDVMKDLRVEPTAFPGSKDISLYEIRQCAHMHNFSPQRELLWERLHSWIERS